MTTEEACEITGLHYTELKRTATKLGMHIQKAVLDGRQCKRNIYSDEQVQGILTYREKSKLGPRTVKAEVVEEETKMDEPQITHFEKPLSQDQLDDLWAYTTLSMHDSGKPRSNGAFWLEKGRLVYCDDLIVEVVFSHESDHRQAVVGREKYPMREWVNEAMRCDLNRPLVLKLKEVKPKEVKEMSLDEIVEASNHLVECDKANLDKEVRDGDEMVEEIMGESVTTRVAPPLPLGQKEEEKSDASAIYEAVRQSNEKTPKVKRSVSIKQANYWFDIRVEKEVERIMEEVARAVSQRYVPGSKLTITTQNYSLKASQEAISRLRGDGWIANIETTNYRNELVLQAPPETLPPATPVPQRYWWQFWK